MSGTDNGFVLLHRKVMDSQVWSDPVALRFFLWAIMRANFRPGWFEGVEVKRGSFITSRDRGAAELGMKPKAWYGMLDRLVKWGCLSVQTSNKWTTVSVCEYETYQGFDRTTRTTTGQREDNGETTSGQRADNEQTTAGQRRDTIEQEQQFKQEKQSLSGADAQTERPLQIVSVPNPKTAPPTPAEVAAYAASINRPIDAERFVAHYAAQGWRRGNGQHVTDWQALVPQWVDRPGQAPAAPAPKPISFDRPPQASPPKPAFWMPETTPVIPLIREQWWPTSEVYFQRLSRVAVLPMDLEPHEVGYKPLDFLNARMFERHRRMYAAWEWMRKQLNCEQPIFEANLTGLYWAMFCHQKAFEQQPDKQYRVLAGLAHKQTVEVFTQVFNSRRHGWEGSIRLMDRDLAQRWKEVTQ